MGNSYICYSMYETAIELIVIEKKFILSDHIASMWLTLYVMVLYFLTLTVRIIPSIVITSRHAIIAMIPQIIPTIKTSLKSI